MGLSPQIHYDMVPCSGIPAIKFIPIHIFPFWEHMYSTYKHIYIYVYTHVFGVMPLAVTVAAMGNRSNNSPSIRALYSQSL